MRAAENKVAIEAVVDRSDFGLVAFNKFLHVALIIYLHVKPDLEPSETPSVMHPYKVLWVFQ